MKNKAFQITLFVFLWVSFADAQVLTGIVCDQATRQPIPNVTVYFDGTSINTATDKAGRFQLNARSVMNTKLVCRHLSYYTILVNNPFEALPDTLFLEERTKTISEVTVTTSRFTRAQKMKAFREQFIGLSKAAKSCTILNEEDIQLDIDPQNRKLVASSENPVIVVNNYLQYKIHFVFVEVWMQYGRYGTGVYTLDNDAIYRTFFAVVSFFEDLAPDNRQIQRRRDNVYATSSNYFFKSLSNNTLKDNSFMIFEKSFPADSRNIFAIKDTLSQKLIRILPRPEMNNETVRIFPPGTLPNQEELAIVPDSSIARQDSMKQKPIYLFRDGAFSKISDDKRDSVIQLARSGGFIPIDKQDSSMQRQQISGSFNANQGISGIVNHNTMDSKKINWHNDPKLTGEVSVLYRKRTRSDIYFSTDSFFVDRYGNIDQIDKIAFTGQFGANRAGDMLPINYELP